MSVVTVLIALLFISQHGLSKELIQVNLVFRHGDRAPIEVYPNDKHTEEQWPDGLGMLTQVGKEQQTRLGKFLRHRYGDFIGNVFSSKEIYVRSSSVDRTIISAYSNLAGLYNNTVQWEGPYIRWMPVPVHSAPADFDEVLKMSRPCARYDVLLEEETGPAMNKLRSDYEDMIQLLLTLTGYGKDSPQPIDLLSHTRDILFCERAHGMELPRWAKWSNMTCADGADIACFNRTVFDILSDIHVYDFYNQTVNSKPLHKFIGGPLVVEIVDNIDRILNQPEETPQLYMYSAHDHTVAAFLAALGAYNTMMPLYTATVMVELYRLDDSEQYIVEVYYRNVTDSDVTLLLNITGCAAPCDLSTFKALYESYRITNWDVECRNNKGLTSQEIVAISVCVTVICLGICLTICLARRRRPSHRYTRVET